MKIKEMREFFGANITYKDWDFLIKEKNEVPYLQIQFVAKDNFTGKVERQYCRKWQLSEWMTKTELVRTAFLAVVQAERHELEEGFHYRGQAIFNSHLSVDKLANLAFGPDATEHRDSPPFKSPSPFKVGQKIYHPSDGEATVTEKTELGFKYKLTAPYQVHPLLGTVKEGECFKDGFGYWFSTWQEAEVANEKYTEHLQASIRFPKAKN